MPLSVTNSKHSYAGTSVKGAHQLYEVFFQLALIAQTAKGVILSTRL